MRLISRRITPLRLLIVGPDGSGKTALTNSLKEHYVSSGFTVKHVHFRPTELVTGDNLPDPTGDPQSQSIRPIAPQIISIIWRWFQYIWAESFQMKARIGFDLVLQERGWWDQMTDPTRYRLSTKTAWLVMQLGRLLPSPDLVLVLGGDPKRIWARKSELDEQEIARQIQAWKEWALDFPNVYIDTTVHELGAARVEVSEAISLAQSSKLVSSLGKHMFLPDRLLLLGMRGSKEHLSVLYKPTNPVRASLRFVSFRLPIIRSAERELVRTLCDLISRLKLPIRCMTILKSKLKSRAIVLITKSDGSKEFVRFYFDKTAKFPAEAEVLRELRGLPWLLVPEVIECGKVLDVSYVRMSEVKSVATSKLLTQDVIDIAVGLRFLRLGVGVTHGDFAWWNFIPGQPLGLIDWEDSSLEFVPGKDITRYLNTLRPRPNEDVRKAVLSEYFIRCQLPDSTPQASSS